MRLLSPFLLLLAELSLFYCFTPPSTWLNVFFDPMERIENPLTIYKTISIRAKNLDSQPNSKYYLAIPHDLYDHYSSIDTYLLPDSGNHPPGPYREKKDLTTKHIEGLDPVNDIIVSYLCIDLPLLEQGEFVEIEIKMLLTNVWFPSPSVIGVNDTQTVKYRVLKSPYSPYETAHS
jgi:hypothetical protein